ncbi:hypothetical protein BDW72DRAFT_203463 [Aspergillus terricola var. indicus]
MFDNVKYCQDKIRRSLFDIKVFITYLLPSNDIDSLERAQAQIRARAGASCAKLGPRATLNGRADGLSDCILACSVFRWSSVSKYHRESDISFRFLTAPFWSIVMDIGSVSCCPVGRSARTASAANPLPQPSTATVLKQHGVRPAGYLLHCALWARNP